MAHYIILGKSGEGHSYSSFYIKHNLIGLPNDELKLKLTEISASTDYSDEDRQRAVRILKNINLSEDLKISVEGVGKSKTS